MPTILPLTAIRQYKDMGDRAAPGSVSLPGCPHCGAKATISLSQHANDAHRDAVSSSGTCPDCSKRCHLWAVFGKRPEAGAWKPETIFLHPEVRQARKSFEGRERLPERVVVAYDQAISVYDAGVWPGCMALCARALEAVIEDLNKRQPAPQADGAAAPRTIPDVLAAHFKAESPITRLADSFRLGRSLGAQTDPTQQADEAAATHMLELIETLLEYVYTLPQRIDAAKESLGNTGATEQKAPTKKRVA